MSYFKSFFSEAFKGIGRNLVMSFSSIGAVFFTLLLLGIFILVSLNINVVTKDIEDQVEIAVFIKETVEDGGLDEIEMYIREMDGVEGLLYVSKEDALQEFIDRIGDSSELTFKTLEGDDNPLPRSFRVKVSEPNLVTATAHKIQRMDGVEKVLSGGEDVNNMFQITSGVRIISLALVALLAVITIFVISNTIRLTVYARRREVNIMKYIGATDFYVRVPFFIEGFIIGFIGAIFAITAVYFGYSAIYNMVAGQFPIFNWVKPTSALFSMLPWFVGGAALLGALGSAMSLRKSLRV